MMRINHRETGLENHDRGLDYDLPRLLHRRGMLKLVSGVGLAGAGLITLGACGSDTSTGAASSPSGRRPAGRPRAARAVVRRVRRPATRRTANFLRRPVALFLGMVQMV